MVHFLIPFQFYILVQVNLKLAPSIIFSCNPKEPSITNDILLIPLFLLSCIKLTIDILSKSLQYIHNTYYIKFHIFPLKYI